MTGRGAADIGAYAERAGLVKADTAPEVGPAIRRRIRTYQALHAVGAALWVIDTRWTIGSSS